MAKRSRNKPTSKNPEQAVQSAAAQHDTAELSREEVKDRLKAMEKEAMSLTPLIDSKELKSRPQPPSVDLEEYWRMADKASQLYELHRQRAEEVEKEAENNKKHYEDQLAKLENERAKLEAEQQRLTEEEEYLAQQKERLAEQDEWLTELSQKTRKFRDDLLTLGKETADQTASGLLDYASHLADAEADFQDQMVQIAEAHRQRALEKLQQMAIEAESLVSERIELEKRRHELQRECMRLNVDQEILEEDQRSFGRLVKERANAELAKLERANKAYEKTLTEAHAEITDLQDQLRKSEVADRRFGDRSPADLLDELEELQRERDKLKREVADRPSWDALGRLSELEHQSESWETERADLKRQLQGSKRRLVDYRIGAVELETLRDQKLAFEASNQILQKQLEELRTDVEKQVAATSQRPPFPSCLDMDQDEQLQESPETVQVPDLAQFVKELQQRIGYDPGSGTELYYSLADIRSFLAGMSMSYLTILQGISGTGKTSLPLHFARAVGGECETIEVQAGWRDRQDLLGHYNSFERKYHESPFLQALYKAQCPFYKDRLFLILLDEMNLSYPEQYFADLLSALEKPDQRERRIRLMTERLAPECRPRAFTDHGRNLPVPANVWFIGTANQDETTKDFADKTYDRAHIIELPIDRPSVKLRKDGRHPKLVSCSGLKSAFDTATQEHSTQAGRCITFLEEDLRKFLGSRFGIGWGHRLRVQLQRYVPVVLASGGSVGEALDYTLSMKVLRKIRNRYENRADDLEKLHDLLLESWKELKDDYSEPVKSLEIIETELRRLKFGGPLEI